MSKELLNALNALEVEKGVKKEIVIEALEAALVSAYKRNYGQAQNVEVEFDKIAGNIHVYAVKEVVNEVYDSQLEISLKSALEINRAYEIGDTIREEVIMQRVRKEEREVIYNEYVQYEQEIVTGEVERRDNKFVYVNLGRIEAVLSRQDQIPGEEYKSHDKIKVYIYKVENTSKGPQVFVSRSHPDLLRRLFEQEIPEIFDGTVEIVSISREAGDRAKVAVRSNEDGVLLNGVKIQQNTLLML